LNSSATPPSGPITERARIYIIHIYRKLAEAELEVAKAERDVAKADREVLKAKGAPGSEVAEAER
jgi:hypothetical protein